MNISERFKKARKALKLTQDDFAKPLGINRSYVASIENGSREPSDTLLKLIEHEHRLSVTWLKTGEGEMFISPEESLKSQLARMGERAFMEAVSNIMKEKGLAVAGGRQNQRAETGDPELDRMINILYDLWTAGNENLKGWTKVQFDMAFPDEVIEKAQKNTQRATGGSPPARSRDIRWHKML